MREERDSSFGTSARHHHPRGLGVPPFLQLPRNGSSAPGIPGEGCLLLPALSPACAGIKPPLFCPGFCGGLLCRKATSACPGSPAIGTLFGLVLVRNKFGRPSPSRAFPRRFPAQPRPKCPGEREHKRDEFLDGRRRVISSPSWVRRSALSHRRALGSSSGPRERCAPSPPPPPPRVRRCAPPPCGPFPRGLPAAGLLCRRPTECVRRVPGMETLCRSDRGVETFDRRSYARRALPRGPPHTSPEGQA